MLRKNKMNLKEKASKLKTDIPAVFIALKNYNTPMIAKVLATITIGYALSPIDLIPDFIPILGYLDDIIILPVLITLTVKCIPVDIWQRSQEASIGMWENGRPKKWYYAIPIIIIWIFLLFFIIKIII